MRPQGQDGEGAPPSRWRAFLRTAARVKDVRTEVDAAEAEPSELLPGGGQEEEGRRLSRSLGPWDLVLLGIGASIGSGIFVVTGVAARDAGPGVVVSFLLAGLASAIDALCYAELAARFPGVLGGAYLFAHATFGELAAFLLFCHLMLDYHIGAASIARSLASYLLALLAWAAPAAAAALPPALSPGGLPLAGGLLSLDAPAPVLLLLLTLVLCRGVRESAALNGAMTCTKVAIVLLVIGAGAFQVDPANWVPLAPRGAGAVVTAASVVFFSYVGFDAVANSAEESKNPQRDLPVGILASLGVCVVLYVAVALVLTGMVPYAELDPNEPLAAAFAARGQHAVEALIGAGAVVGLTTALLAGLYVQARLYVALGRDGLLPPFFARVSASRQSPVTAQLWVGAIAAVLSLFFDVGRLSHILSVGVMVSYSLVCICVIMLRLDPAYVPPAGRPAAASAAIRPAAGRWEEAAGCVGALCLLSFLLGLATRLQSPPWLSALLALGLLASAAPILLRQKYERPTGFACPLVPGLPLLGVAFNIYLIAQMHVEAWVRLVLVTLVGLLVYVVYGQHHSSARSLGSYRKVSVEITET